MSWRTAERIVHTAELDTTHRRHVFPLMHTLLVVSIAAAQLAHPTKPSGHPGLPPLFEALVAGGAATADVTGAAAADVTGATAADVTGAGCGASGAPVSIGQPSPEQATGPVNE